MQMFKHRMKFLEGIEGLIPSKYFLACSLKCGLGIIYENQIMKTK